jgi:hypothetical protein
MWERLVLGGCDHLQESGERPRRARIRLERGNRTIEVDPKAARAMVERSTLAVAKCNCLVICH